MNRGEYWQSEKNNKKESSMNRTELASELVRIASMLVDADDKTKTFECPECGTKVLENTGYCLKCKEKVKEADDKTKTFECPKCGTKVLENTGYCLKCKEKVEKA